MWNHDRYQELAALAAAGQVSGAELEDFLEHVEYCTQCKDLFSYFAQLHDQELPLVSGQKSFFTSTTPVPSGFTERFLRKAREQGIQLSQEQQPHFHSFIERFFTWGQYPKLLAGALLIVLVAAGIHQYTTHSSWAKAQPANQGAQIASAQKPAADTSLLEQIRTLSASNEQMQQELATLQREHENDAETVRGLEAKLRDAHLENETWQSEFSRHLAQEEASFRQKDDQLQRARAELQSAQRLSAENNADVVALQAKIQDLTDQVRVQHEAAERERELISADRDIRDLMGARNLHIVDVIDADPSGKQTRAFGRVFYTEGKSLIFYAYDLSESRLKDASYSFQVWGKKETGSVQKLGALFQDDQHQRRWVLKVNDASVLHNISSVFVTIGPTHGTREPQGKELLYAFLDMKPNHP